MKNEIRVQWERDGGINYRIFEIDVDKSQRVGRKKWRAISVGSCWQLITLHELLTKFVRLDK